ncbi:uncharacterized protein DFL_008783 [Arthrobotrys flagrans]|uniref:Zinc finger H2C2-type histone UAS binding domain-containing protein n=1 Tax=Arthrobotrys flagrans TaxID=97331 RepID=A0A436ZPT3_ARTFL|nr:hypothetical protein DFL_008783 [Arthrobotrys flagrans]
MNSSGASEEAAIAGAIAGALAAVSSESEPLARKRKWTPGLTNATPPVIKHAFFKDRVTPITIFPIPPGHRLPEPLLLKLCAEFNHEIERGNTFPFTEPMSLPQFQSYWFSNYAAIMMKGREETLFCEGRDWENDCLGTFLVFPRYPGRSSHICTGQFLICQASRGKGAGKVLVSTFLDYATRLAYSSAMFDLIYETNEPILHILETQGFKRIGTIKAAGLLLLPSGSTDPVDSIILSRDLVEEEDFQSNERFEKIRYYLEKGKYPPSATRSEKSRLRSAATHYKLVGEKLMLKDKEVISDPQRQYEIARDVHKVAHGGINKTTAQIADRYHWIQIKRTVSQVLKNCAECTQNARPPVVKAITPAEKQKELDNNEATSSTTSAAAAAAGVLGEPPSRGNDADGETETDGGVMGIPQLPDPDSILDLPSPIPTHHLQHPSVLIDHPHRAIKSPPGHHHHQLAQSIRSQHDAMSLSQQQSVIDPTLGSVVNRTGVGLLTAAGLPINPAIVEEVVRQMAIQQQHNSQHSQQHSQHHHHHHHHSHHHSHHTEDTMDDMNIMDNFEDIQQFDDNDLQLIGSPSRSDGDVINMEEAERRRHARDMALIAEAVAATRNANAAAGRGGEEGDMLPPPFD